MKFCDGLCIVNVFHFNHRNENVSTVWALNQKQHIGAIMAY